MSQRTRLGVIAAAVAVAVAGFVIASSGGEKSKRKRPLNPPPPSAATTGARPAKPKPPPTPEIVVRNGKPAGGVKTIRVAKGERVRFTVRSDVADEVHVHGYDLTKDVAAGGSVAFAFRAKIDGKFEVELEQRAEPIASLEVEP